jgi:hypothetical protein
MSGFDNTGLQGFEIAYCYVDTVFYACNETQLSKLKSQSCVGETGSGVRWMSCIELELNWVSQTWTLE